MGTLYQDLRFGVRMLLKSPGFTLIAVVTLALGIGANTAIFSVVNAVLLRPMPFPEPERLMIVRETNQGKDTSISMPDYKIWRDRNQTFEQIAAFDYDSFTIAANAEPERVDGASVSVNFFPLLGVSPAQGRAFNDQESIFGNHRVVIMSSSLWARKFGAQTRLDAQTVRINNEVYAVIGIMPGGFEFPSQRTTLWVPLALPENHSRNTRGNYWLDAVARLKPSATIEQAQQDLNKIHERLREELKETQGFGARVVPLHEATVGNVRRALLTLLVAVGCVLLIACVNVANLLLARASVRQREMAIRGALGAGRRRLVRQLLTESILLSVIGGVIGLGLASWGVEALLRLEPNLPRATSVSVDWQVLLFILGLSFLTSLLFGLAPAWQAAKTDLNESLKEGGKGTSGGGGRWLNGLVITETALAVALLVGAGLFINSFLRLQRVDPGYRTQNLLTMRLSLPESKYPRSQQARVIAFFDQLIERVRALPGVESVATTSWLPLYGAGSWGKMFTREDQPPPKSLQDTAGLDYTHISPDYFKTLGIRILKGRSLDSRDTRESLPVAVINESMANRFYPNEDPIGKVFKLGPPEELLPAGILPPGYRFIRWTIVGVAADVKQTGLKPISRSMVYTLPVQTQSNDGVTRNMSLAVHTSDDPTALVGAIRRQVAELDSELPLADVATMQELFDRSIARERFNTTLLTIFAGVALLLSVIGIYGVMSYSVTRRTREIGVRMALGAGAGEMQRLVLRQGMKTALIGVGTGLALAFGLTRLIKTMLFGVDATDPFTFFIVTAMLLIASFLACYLPARRATKVDPMVALRAE
jgi:putative ABC transport system permease protein